MTGLVFQLIPLALATVVSPLVFISLFLVLQGDPPVRRGIAFVTGLVVAVAATAVASAFLAHGRVDPGGAVDGGISWFNLGLGVTELGAGLWLRFRGPAPGHATTPAILRRLEGAGLAVVALVGVVVPTYPAAVSAGTVLLRTPVEAGGRLTAVVIYLVLCTLVVSVPVVMVGLRGETARQRIHRACDWLLQHSSTVGSTILLLVGGYLVVNSLATAP